MPMMPCPQCRSLIAVTIPELEVPQVALAILPGIAAAEWEDGRERYGDAALVEAAFQLARAYVDQTHAFLRGKAVADGAV